MSDLREKLRIDPAKLEQINALLLDPDDAVIGGLLDVVARYGGPDEINAKAREAATLEHRLGHLRELDHPYLEDLEFFRKQAEAGAFVTIEDYRRGVLGDAYERTTFNEQSPVTLEVSAMQYFPWLRGQVEQAIDRKELMPGRFIRVRNMKEQLEDGDIYAVGAAMDIFGASIVETLDTKGTDGSNTHLGGPETITGYFGGVGQPNEHAIAWVEEYLDYYTKFGIRQVLNVNAGTIFLAYMLHKLGVDIEFKISVYMGTDNPFSTLWTMLAARLFSRDDGTTSLVGLNFANSVNNDTIEKAAALRKALGLEEDVRFEHHIVETWKSIVVQPYDRRAELVELAAKVKNISAKHEGGDLDVEKELDHPSDILDYFLPKKEVVEQGLMDALERNYIEKHNAVNHTARALTEAGLSFVAARNLHR
jgi:antitoxin component of MazEF toxin-antitoxin module